MIEETFKNEKRQKVSLHTIELKADNKNMKSKLNTRIVKRDKYKTP